MSGKKKQGSAASKVAVPQVCHCLPSMFVDSLMGEKKVKQTPSATPAPAKKGPAVEPKASGPSPKGGAKPKKTT